MDTEWIGNDKSASHRLSQRVAGFRRGKGVSQAQSGRGGGKGCSPLGSCMPVDSAAADVRNGIASGAHARKGGVKSRSLPLQAFADGPLLNIPRLIAGRRWVALARDSAFSLCNLRLNRVNAGYPNELGADWKYQLQWAGSRSMPAEVQALLRTNKTPSPDHLLGLSVVTAADSDSVVPVAHAHTDLAKRSVTQLIRG